MLDKILRQFRGVSSGRGEESIDRSTDAVFLLFFGKLPVLVLRHDAQGWRMFYTKEFKAQEKVKPLVPFPDEEKVYRSAELWPFFAVRIPSIARPEVRRTIVEEKLDYDDVCCDAESFWPKKHRRSFRAQTEK